MCVYANLFKILSLIIPCNRNETVADGSCSLIKQHANIVRGIVSIFHLLLACFAVLLETLHESLLTISPEKIDDLML